MEFLRIENLVLKTATNTWMGPLQVSQVNLNFATLKHQLIKRIVYDTVPVTIEYKLTLHTKTLDKVILELRNWGMLHRKKILGKS